MKRKFLRGGSLNCVLYATVAEQSSKRPVTLRWDEYRKDYYPFFWTGTKFALADSDTYKRFVRWSDHG